MTAKFSLMVHGGAGGLGTAAGPEEAAAFRAAILAVLAQGRMMLARGASALDTVETCAALLEDEPLFNAGIGSVLNEDGFVETDAGIMDGRSLRVGAIAAVRGVRNPVRLARQVMEQGRSVLLVAGGALRLAEQLGIARVPDEYFLTPKRIEQWRRARSAVESGTETPASDALGTIGAAARDIRGDLAAATSTGGVLNKAVGRVGDSPIVGAGVYADNASCAVSATGRGEDMLRTVLARTVAGAIEHRGMDAGDAVSYGIERLRQAVSGMGGLICIDLHGHCASGMTTPRMIRGWIEHGGESRFAL